MLCVLALRDPLAAKGLVHSSAALVPARPAAELDLQGILIPAR
jgi:hypothetical protein